MAKAKLVAKVRFDDGSKRGEDNKSKDYEIGEAYQGSNADALKKQGLLCSEAELSASKEALDDKDKTIRALEDKLMEANRLNQKLQKEIAELKAEQKPAKKKGGKADESQDEQPQE